MTESKTKLCLLVLMSGIGKGKWHFKNGLPSRFCISMAALKEDVSELKENLTELRPNMKVKYSRKIRFLPCSVWTGYGNLKYNQSSYPI